MDPARQRPSPRADRMSRPRRVSTRERRIVRGFPRIKLAVAGDLIADEFIYGRLDRVSREAPVLIPAMPQRTRRRWAHRSRSSALSVAMKRVDGSRRRCRA